MCPQATDTWRAQKLGEAGRALPWRLQGSSTLPHLDLRLLAPDRERMKSCRLKASGLWSLAAVAPGKDPTLLQALRKPHSPGGPNRFLCAAHGGLCKEKCLLDSA